MAALVRRGELADDDVRSVGRLLARFHASASALTPSDPVGDVRRACEHNARELLALADEDTARRIIAADRFAAAFLAAHRDMFVARATAGRIRDGHGDLRAEHVVLEQPLAIVDRLEFDARLRETDVADDIAFLVMDLERLGAGAHARLLVAAYRDAGGDPAAMRSSRSTAPTARSCGPRSTSCEPTSSTIRLPVMPRARMPRRCSASPSVSRGVPAARSRSRSAVRRRAASRRSPRSSHGAAAGRSCRPTWLASADAASI